MINHKQQQMFVMLVEIPDPEVILSIVIAFFVGLLALYLYTKIHGLKVNSSTSNLERLDYYERQLIDMKIRLDALDLLDVEPWSESNNQDSKPILENSPKKQELVKGVVVQGLKKQRLPNLNSNDMIDVILGLIMDKLMKKLYQDGLVERNTKTKPYTYSITESGKTKVGLLKNNSITA